MKRDILLLYDAENMRLDGMSRPKNQEIVRRLSGILGGTVIRPCDESDNPLFGYPYNVVPNEVAMSANVHRPGEIYGASVAIPQHADKSMLHQLVPKHETPPSWYSSDFAKEVNEAVLPGYTVFSIDEAVQAYEVLKAKYGPRVRIKLPDSKGGIGHFTVDDFNDYMIILTDSQDVIYNGIVLEPELDDSRTLAVSHLRIRDYGELSWTGTPRSTIDGNGMTRFGGTKIRANKGGFSELFTNATHELTRRAVGNAAIVNHAYVMLGATVSRATYDIVTGISSNGTTLQGVTDPSLRPTASTPAEIVALEKLHQGDVNTVDVEISYQYDVKGTSKFTESNAQKGHHIFASSPYVSISYASKVNN